MSRRKKASILVCAAGRWDCDRLIWSGKQLAQACGARLQVLCVQPLTNGYHVNSEEMEHLYQVTGDAGAEMTVVFDDDAPLIAANFARRVKAKQLVTGVPGGESSEFLERLCRLLPGTPISMVSAAGELVPVSVCRPQKNLLPAMG